MKVALNASQTLQPDLASSCLTQQLELNPEQNDNTCGLELQIRSLQFQTLAHPSVRDSGVRPGYIHHA